MASTTACHLVERQSLYSPCTWNVSYGCTADSVWVDRGCRGLIRCGGQSVPCGSAGARTRRFTCPCGNGSAALSRQIDFVHIPKTAGESLQHALNDEFGAGLIAFGPARASKGGRIVGGNEKCLRDSPRERFRISMFRRPRAHVVSQYLECRDATWARTKPRRTCDGCARFPGDELR